MNKRKYLRPAVSTLGLFKKLNMAFDIGDVPDEVLKAWVIEIAANNYGIGWEMYKEYNDIKNKYPEYFQSTKEDL